MKVVRKLLDKLHGKKFLILGNHDKSSEHLDNYFVQITNRNWLHSKSLTLIFLTRTFKYLCVIIRWFTWASKHYGVINAHGHCHGRLDDYNEASTDLRVDVGIDGKLANFNFITLEQIYKYFKEKTKGEKFIHYAMEKKTENSMVI